MSSSSFLLGWPYPGFFDLADPEGEKPFQTRHEMAHFSLLTISRNWAITQPEIAQGLAGMIVCVCNRLNETRIRMAISAGAETPCEVYKGCGVERNCGRCQDTIAEMLDEMLTPELDKAA